MAPVSGRRGGRADGAVLAWAGAEDRRVLEARLAGRAPEGLLALAEGPPPPAPC